MTKVEEKFRKFLEKWAGELEDLMKELVRAEKETEIRGAIGKVTLHIKSYYKEKWEGAHEDVMAFFCPIWMNPLHNSFQWVTGWKPSTLFRLINNVQLNLSRQQLNSIDDLRLKIKIEEDKVDREMERQQVSMSHTDHINGVVLDLIFVRLEKLLKFADCIRLKALKGILDQLTPSQSVRFLASFSLLFLHFRNTNIPTTSV